ncbi:MAG: metallophosphoesterase [Acidimicrobiia bacterium]|nr:metallophosphoesterase [Acidimicrobiia bacterium]
MTLLRFVVVADSHIRFPDDDIATYPSNALLVDRNRRVVEMCNRLKPEFVIHLGDIVHPLPVEDGHEAAVQLAADVYVQLEVPIHYVAGNHDIGDKPDAMVAVPAVAEENYGVFERYWGRPFKSFDQGGCHFVILDTPVLNSGLGREQQQRSWLEEDFAAASAAEQRIFVFTHYPPFVRAATEDEHYDNLGEPARGWLLDMCARYQVEAMFSGHVHNFLFNRHEGTDLYVVPATGFVRPDYSELAAVTPEREGGRDDPAKLGFFVVDIDEIGHNVRPVRTFGATNVGGLIPAVTAAVVEPGWECPLGVTLRHGWMSVVDFPTAGLDEFRRKRVRNDSLLPALWEARINRVRIPVEDLAPDEGMRRVRQLARRGLRCSVRSAGIPDMRTIARVGAVAELLERWELVLWPHQFEALYELQAELPDELTLAVSPLVPIGEESSGAHHFVTSGFEIGDLSDLLLPERVGELVFRAPAGVALDEVVDKSRQLAADRGRSSVVNVELPRGGESVMFDDDDAVAELIEEAVAAALARPEATVFLDGFVDHDRSYYPHHGLVDRHSNPRRALYRLIAASSGMARL